MGLLLAHSSMKLLTGIKQDTFVHDFVCFFFGCCIIFAIKKKRNVVQSAFITKLITIETQKKLVSTL